MDYKNILQKIQPSKEDVVKVQNTTNFIIESLNIPNTEIIVGGSSAKGTFLKGDFDVDIFVRFKKGKDYSDILHSHIKNFCKENKIKYERVHGSRDYFKLDYEKINFEIVPVKYVKNISEVENVTDMSPLHVDWTTQNLNPKLKKDIILAKQFCKAQRIYGAESYINGFSGHVIDILIIYYGGFNNMLKFVSKWGAKTIIDIEKMHEDVFKSLNESKLQSPLIVIDPIDHFRNASASISKENYDKFILSAKEFLKNPSEKYFKIPKFKKPKISQKEICFILEIIPLEGKKDVIGSKVLKVLEFLKRELNEYGFNVLKSDWFFDKKLTKAYLILPKENISQTYIRKGPRLINKKAVENFKAKHKTIFEENGFACVNLKREFVNAEKYLKRLLKDEYVVSRVNKINLI